MFIVVKRFFKNLKRFGKFKRLLPLCRLRLRDNELGVSRVDALLWIDTDLFGCQQDRPGLCQPFKNRCAGSDGSRRGIRMTLIMGQVRLEFRRLVHLEAVNGERIRPLRTARFRNAAVNDELVHLNPPITKTSPTVTTPPADAIVC